MINEYKKDLKEFKILEKLCLGANQYIYSVKNEKNNKIYAAKVISSIDFIQIKAKIDKELNIIFNMHHSTINTFYGYSLTDFEGKESITLIMELVSHKSLSELLKKVQKNQEYSNYNNTSRQKILVGIARGMMYLHQHNVIHGDLKPGNILIDDKYNPHISDFGLSKIYSQNHINNQLETTSSIIYLAPEIIEGGEYDFKSDVYSFGILIYEIITGLIPYPNFLSGNLSLFEFKSKILTENYRPEFTIPIKDSIRSLIEQCWSKNPSKRPTFEYIFNQLAHNVTSDFYLDGVDTKELNSYIEEIKDDKFEMKKEKENQSNDHFPQKSQEKSDIEIERVIYDPLIFPRILVMDQNKKFTKEDLSIPFFYCQLYRNSDERFELNEEKFDKTLTVILSNDDEILIVRTVILIFLMKNIFDVTNIFNRLLNEEENQHQIFDENFFNELKTNQILFQNTIEIIQSYIEKYSLDNESLFSFITKIIEAYETSPTPIDSNQLKFIEKEEFVNEKIKQKIEKKYPLILPFKMKYKEFCEYKQDLPIVTINVDRENVLQSVWKLDDEIMKNFNFKLKTNFGEGEDDEGGPTREFIHLAFNEIVKPETGLFELRNGNYWFKYHKEMTCDMKNKYRSIGIFFGISILNQLILPIHFPRYFYKKLFHREICIADLNLYDTQLFDTIKFVNDHSIKEEDMLDFTFSDYKNNYEINLIDFSYIENSIDFQPKSLVDENKIEYISKTLKWVFDLSIKEQFKSFEEGFKKIKINPFFYKNFTLDEIDKIVSGDRVKDWNSLKLNAKYLGGYSADSQVIKWFWHFFDDLNEDKKFEALRFITGSASIPVGGLKSVIIRFLKVDDVDQLPISHTCFSQIDLPDYKTYEELVMKCKEAFPNMRFGFA